MPEIVMKKRAAYLVLAILILSVSLGIFASAQQASETEKVESAYLWLIQQTSGKWSNLDMETMSLSLLALVPGGFLIAASVLAFALWPVKRGEVR